MVFTPLKDSILHRRPCSYAFYNDCFQYFHHSFTKTATNNDDMSKREAFLAATYKENVEDFLRFIQLHVSYITNYIENTLEMSEFSESWPVYTTRGLVLDRNNYGSFIKKTVIAKLNSTAGLKGLLLQINRSRLVDI